VVHGPPVPVLVRVAGAPPAFFAAGADRRVRLAINGVAIPYAPADWVGTPAGPEYRAHLDMGGGLRDGLNVLEVSVVDGQGGELRTTGAFLVDPAAASLAGTLTVDAALSVFDVRGDDHLDTLGERVAFRWSGAAALPIRGWRVQDREAHHVHRFGDAVIAAGGLMVLRTGGSPGDDGPEVVHWGRRRAVWNNRAGDTVLLVDDRGFVRATHDVPPGRRSR